MIDKQIIDKIQEIIKTAPKRFTQILRADPEMVVWIEANSLVVTDNFSEKIHSALNQKDRTCSNGQHRKFLSITKGWGFCGPAKCCKCNAENSSKLLKEIKTSYSTEKKNSVNNKREKTMIDKYGVAFNSQRTEIKKLWCKPRVAEPASKLLTDSVWMHQQYVENQRNLTDIADELGVYYGTVGEYCRKQGFKIRQRSQYSQEEQQISAFLNSINIKHQTGNWDVLGDRELDIWIPDSKLAIEVNGLYWHSFNPSSQEKENAKKHLEKSQRCEDLGISLIHITDWEWHNKQAIIKNLLMSKLGLNNKIGARKCQVTEIPNTQAREWFQQHHLQGSASAHRSFALIHNSEIQLAVSIGKSRFDKNYEFELIRLCGAPGVTVVGGVSKSMSHVKNLFGGDILTYCDRSKSQARGYLNSGFSLVGVTDPGYFWTNGTDVISRFRCQRRVLKNWLPNYCETLSESANMFSQKYRRYWDCGNWILKY